MSFKILRIIIGRKRVSFKYDLSYCPICSKKLVVKEVTKIRSFYEKKIIHCDNLCYRKETTPSDYGITYYVFEKEVIAFSKKDLKTVNKEINFWKKDRKYLARISSLDN